MFYLLVELLFSLVLFHTDGLSFFFFLSSFRFLALPWLFNYRHQFFMWQLMSSDNSPPSLSIDEWYTICLSGHLFYSPKLPWFFNVALGRWIFHKVNMSVLDLLLHMFCTSSYLVLFVLTMYSKFVTFCIFSWITPSNVISFCQSVRNKPCYPCNKAGENQLILKIAWTCTYIIIGWSIPLSLIRGFPRSELIQLRWVIV